MRSFSCVFAVVLLLTGCKSSEPIDPAMDKLGRATGPVEPGAAPPPGMMGKGMPPGMMGKGMPPGMMGKGMPPGMGKVHKGVVLEAIPASRYTYVHLKPESGEPLWAAVPQVELKKGQPIEVIESLVMQNFESPTLKRTFPSIVFGVLPGTEAPAGMPGKMGGGMMPPPAGEMPPGHPPIQDKAQPTPADAGPAKAPPAEAPPTTNDP